MLAKLQEQSPQLTVGQVLSNYVRTRLLTCDQLTTVQEATVIKNAGGSFEPSDPQKVLEEIQRNLFDSNWEALIRILKQLPTVSQAVAVPADVRLDDRRWRLNNLYHIVNKNGELQLFQFNEAQTLAYEEWEANNKLVILKSRQHGISTLWLVVAYDMALFEAHKSIGLMSQGLSESRKLFARISTMMKYLPPYVMSHLGLGIDTDNMNELKFSNNSTIYIATSFRSATLHFLHVSELGKIASEHPERVRELISGTLPAVGKNSVIIESTALGENEFKTMWDNAVEKKTKYTPLFLPWMIDASCVDDVALVTVNEDYFAKIDYEFSEEQKNFYTNTLVEQGSSMLSEFPSNSEEAFSATSVGRYYEKVLQKNSHMQVEGRSLFAPELPVYVSADLGISDISSYVIYQVGYEAVTILACIHANEEPIEFFANEINMWTDKQSARYSKKVKIHKLHLPHDSKKRDIGWMKSAVGIWNKLNFRTQVLKRTAATSQDIKVVQNYLPYVQFDMSGVGVSDLLEALKKYSRKFVSGYWSDEPQHKGSDLPDSFRYVIMSPVVQKKKITELARARQEELASEEFREHRANGSTTVLKYKGVELSGDSNYHGAEIKDIDDFTAEVAHNTRNSTIADDGGGIEDGIDMGGGSTNWDYHNEQFTKENGGSFTPKEKDPYSKGWI